MNRDHGVQEGKGVDSPHTVTMYEGGGARSVLCFQRSGMISLVFVGFRDRLFAEHQSDIFVPPPCRQTLLPL